MFYLNGRKITWAENNVELLGKSKGCEIFISNIKESNDELNIRLRDIKDKLVDAFGPDDSKGGYFADVDNKHWVSDGDGSYPIVIEMTVNSPTEVWVTAYYAAENGLQRRQRITKYFPNFFSSKVKDFIK